MPEYSLRELAQKCGGTLIGDGDAVIKGFASLERARKYDLSFCASKKAKRAFAACRAGAVICLPGSEKPDGVGALIIHDEPDQAFTDLYSELLPSPPSPDPDIHPTAVIAESATIGENVYLGPYVVIGERVTIGAGSKIHPHCVVMEDSTIGEGCTFYPHCVIREGSKIGEGVLLQPGAVIGADGFGYSVKDGVLEQVPQRGNVVLGAQVHVGANACIDRARFASTRVGDGTKIDNLVQIGHNVQIGATCGIAALSGLGGSCEVGDFVNMAGFTGIPDGQKIGSGAKLFGRCAVDRDVEPGETLYWAPGRSPMQTYRLFALFDRLPEMAKTVKRLDKTLAAITGEDA